MVKDNIAITYSPYNRKFYAGKFDGDGTDFSKDYGMEAIAKLNPDKKIGDGRIEPISYETFRSAERAFKSGNIDATSLANITVIDLLSEVIRREWRDFNAIHAVRRIPVPKLQLNVPITNKFGANKKVPELAQAANEQIVTAIEGLTTTACGDWGAMISDGDFSNRNPLDDLVDAVVTITSNHFRPDTLCVHPKVISDYLSNTFIHAATRPDDREFSGVFDLPKMPSIKSVVDVGFTNTVATIFDSRTMLLGEGPTIAESFRDPYRS